MIKIKQFHFALDNLGYLIYGNSEAVAIDCGAFEQMLAFIRSKGLSLSFIANTHNHADHIMGNDMILKSVKTRLLSYDDLPDGTAIEIEGAPIRIYHTPGHTEDSICFLVHGYLITGDTLFNGTVGNCFSGDLSAFYESIKRIMDLPGNTVVYAGHDYVRDAMAYAKKLEPENGKIDIYLKNYSPDHIWSMLKDEMDVNPYLRFNEEKIISFLRQRGFPTATEWERWQSLMSIP